MASPPLRGAIPGSNDHVVCWAVAGFALMMEDLHHITVILRGHLTGVDVPHARSGIPNLLTPCSLPGIPSRSDDNRKEVMTSFTMISPLTLQNGHYPATSYRPRWPTLQLKGQLHLDRIF